MEDVLNGTQTLKEAAELQRQLIAKCQRGGIKVSNEVTKYLINYNNNIWFLGTFGFSGDESEDLHATNVTSKHRLDRSGSRSRKKRMTSVPENLHSVNKLIIKQRIVLEHAVNIEIHRFYDTTVIELQFIVNPSPHRERRSLT
ncbi:hypothetical protein CEXT_261771 [Caerostris extrusa]|uniref:Uncharacterized protein n=1 Tax=Caerostris extrusa TaxID=172846 RepID=A0AAV4PJB3_CAEEX|nr:hypothetical protein CEXT_261771 [Caerostris extrusa]